MLKKRFTPLLIVLSAVTLSTVVLKVEPPKSLNEASLPQLALFFIPLGVFLTLLANLILTNWAKSTFLVLGVMLLLFLKSLNILNSITFLGGVLGITLILKLITKPAKPKFRHSTKEDAPHLLKPLPKAKPPKLSRTTPKIKINKALPKITRLESK